MEIKEQKKEIRKAIRELKKAFSQNERDLLSVAVADNLLSLPEISGAKTILLYYSLPDEVNTEFLIEKLSNHRAGDKRLILPVVDGDFLLLKEYIPEEMVKGYQNISEPAGIECVSPAEMDLAIIPGVAFDSKCNRMGRGKGFYDRLLPYLNCKKIGLGFDFQIVDSIPCEDFDKPLDMVITEKKIYVK